MYTKLYEVVQTSVRGIFVPSQEASSQICCCYCAE